MGQKFLIQSVPDLHFFYYVTRFFYIENFFLVSFKKNICIYQSCHLEESTFGGKICHVRVYLRSIFGGNHIENVHKQKLF